MPFATFLLATEVQCHSQPKRPQPAQTSASACGWYTVNGPGWLSSLEADEVGRQSSEVPWLTERLRPGLEPKQLKEALRCPYPSVTNINTSIYKLCTSFSLKRKCPKTRALVNIRLRFSLTKRKQVPGKWAISRAISDPSSVNELSTIRAPSIKQQWPINGCGPLSGTAETSKIGIKGQNSITERLDPHQCQSLEVSDWPH